MRPLPTGERRESAGKAVRENGLGAFANNVPSAPVLSEPYECRMPQMVVAGPLEELELTNEYRLQPLTLGHLCLRQTLPPPPAPSFRQVDEGTLAGLEAFELSEQLRTRDGSESVAGTRDVDQLVVFVVTEDQSLEGLRSLCQPADDEFLAAIDAHLHPRASSEAGFVEAVAALGDEAFESMGLHRFDQDRQFRVERRRIPHGLRQFGKDSFFEQLSASVERLTLHVLSGQHHYIEHVVHDWCGCRAVVLQDADGWP